MFYFLRRFFILSVVFIGFLLPNEVEGQVDYSENIRAFLSINGEEKALDKRHDFVITDEVVDKQTGLTHVYVQHTLEGLPIINHISGFHFNSKNKLEYSALRIPNTKLNILKKEKRFNSAQDVLQRVADILELPNSFKLEKSKESASSRNRYSAPKLSSEDIFMRESLLSSDEGYIPIWEVGIYEDDVHKWQVLHIDIASGKEINRNSWTYECFNHEVEDHPERHESHDVSSNAHSMMSCDSTYNVFAYPLTSPGDGAQSLVTSPWNMAVVASPDGWHDTTFLSGNNAYAVEDYENNNSGGYTVDGGAQLCFDQLHYDTLGVIQNVDVSLTNAFYWSNLIHDIMYMYGFDEVAGNFQQSNFDRGGLGFDRVNVDILDGSGINNANFSTPPDGFPARMQMFEWIPSVGSSLQIKDANDSIEDIDMLPALFGANNLTLIDTIVIGDPILACDTIENDNLLAGQIALIDRGDCAFSEKALEIQRAGAIAMIVCNDVSTAIFRMGGDGTDSIEIPSIMVGQTDCDSLKLKLEDGVVVATITIPSTYDSGLDNGILIHEYAHGVSTRLTGGPATASCLTGNEQMGEGWSDWYALMLTLDASDIPEDPIGIGAYVLGQDQDGAGIRNYPYSTDLTVNPVTYDDISSFSVPHGVGTVWASALWDMTWNLIGTHGFDPDIYNGLGGNNIALRLVTLGLKLQPCDPGFVDGRDAVLAADALLYNGANECLIWKAFARRGIGFGADQGSSISSNDGTENFDLPPSCSIPLFYNSTTDGIAYTEDTLQLHFDIRTNSVTVDTGIICADMSNELMYYSGDYTTISGDSITFLETDIDSNTWTYNNIEATISANDSSSIYYLERVRELPSDWQIISDEGTQNWEVSDSFPYQDSLSFFCRNVEGNQTQLLISPTFAIEGPTFLGFWHYYNLEENWDGAFVELSIDKGQSWIDIGLNAITNGYSSTLKLSSNPFSEGRLAYTGTNEAYQQTIIDLSPYDGNDVQVRFVLASDRFAHEDGWYIDNISLYHKYEIEVHSLLKTDEGAMLFDTLSIIVLPECEPCPKDLCDYLISVIDDVDQDLYKAFQYIESDANLSNTDDVIFLAGDSILLNKNFTVSEQAVFQAIIDNCVEP